MVLTVPRDHYRPSPLLPSAISLDNHDLDRGFALKDLFSPFTKEPNYEHWRVISKFSTECLTLILERNRNSKYFQDTGLTALIEPFFDSNDKIIAEKTEELIKVFRENTKLSSYSDYESYIERMFKDGEQGLLHKFQPDFWVKTSGTTGASPKLFPFFKPDGFLEHWSDFPSRHIVGTVHALSGFKHFNTRSRGIDLIFKGSKLTTSPNGISVGTLGSFLEPSPNNIEPKMAKLLPTPVCRLRVAVIFALCEANLEYFRCLYLYTLVDFFTVMESDWDLLLSAIETGKISDEFQLSPDVIQELEDNLEPRPSRAAYLRSLTKNDPSFEGIVPRIWPKLALIVGAFSSHFMVHRRTCQFYTTRAPFYIESGYTCSEATVGFAIGLLSNHHVLNITHNYMEFLPIAGSASTPIQACELQVGREYEPILTTMQSCLLRYKLGDVVRMMGWYNNLPVVQLVRRRLDTLSIRGANLYEETMVRALDGTKLLRNHFCCFEDSLVSPPRLGIYVELVPSLYNQLVSERWRSEISEASLIEATASIHRFLETSSDVYLSTLGSPDPSSSLLLRLVPPGTFWRLMQLRPDSRPGSPSSHVKLPLGIYDTVQLELLSTAAAEVDLIF